MVCNVLDFRCVIVNELIGNVTMAIILLALLYFIICAKLKLSFNIMIFFSVPIILGLGLMLGGFSIIYAFITLLVGIMLALLLMRMIGNK